MTTANSLWRSSSGSDLLRRFLLTLRVGEALGFFAATCPFPHVVSAVTVSHNDCNLSESLSVTRHSLHP